MNEGLTLISKLFRGSPYYYEKIEGIVFGKAPLDFLSLNFPPICNYRCAFCFAAKTLSNQKYLSEMREKMLTPAEYSKIIAEAKNLGVRHIEISGEGEPDFPVFRETLKHIIREATKSGIHTTIFANGSWIDRDILTFFAGNDTSLVISIKYLTSEKYDKSVGVDGAYDKVMQNISLAKEIYGRTYEKNNMCIYNLAFFSAILEDNFSDNLRLRDYCDSQDIFFGLSTRIPQGNSEGVEVDFADQDAIVKQLAHNSIILSDSARGDIGFPVCGTFYYGLGINYDGEVVFEAHAPETAGKIGNIKEIGLATAVKRQRNLRDIFYQQGGSSYCPLRDAAYKDFSEKLKKMDC